MKPTVATSFALYYRDTARGVSLAIFGIGCALYGARLILKVGAAQ